jgi:hypothetical protein
MRALTTLLRWFHPWEQQNDEERAEEVYRHYTDSLG